MLVHKLTLTAGCAMLFAAVGLAPQFSIPESAAKEPPRPPARLALSTASTVAEPRPAGQDGSGSIVVARHDKQVKAAEAEVKRLGLEKVNTFKDGIDTRFPIRFGGKGGEVQVSAGSAKLVELPKPTRVMTWSSGNNLPEGIGDQDGPEFSHVLCDWAADGKLVWVMYRSKDS
jgi:hypothetical protein